MATKIYIIYEDNIPENIVREFHGIELILDEIVYLQYSKDYSIVAYTKNKLGKVGE